jgi:hypothetical protein
MCTVEWFKLPYVATDFVKMIMAINVYVDDDDKSIIRNCSVHWKY